MIWSCQTSLCVFIRVLLLPASPVSFIHSFIHSSIHSFIHSFIHSSNRPTLMPHLFTIDAKLWYLFNCIHPSTHPIPSYPIPSYPILSHPILSHPILSYPILSHPIPSHPIPSHPIPSYPIPSYPILSHPIPSYPILSHPIPSYPIPSHPSIHVHSFIHFHSPLIPKCCVSGSDTAQRGNINATAMPSPEDLKAVNVTTFHASNDNKAVLSMFFPWQSLFVSNDNNPTDMLKCTGMGPESFRFQQQQANSNSLLARYGIFTHCHYFGEFSSQSNF